MDTVLNPLVIIKKAITDIILKDKKAFNTGTGYMQSPFVNIESWRPASNSQKSPNFNKLREASSNRKMDQQYEMAIRETMAVFLDTLSAIFLKCKTQETYKMITEVFIKDNAWQEAVQSYSNFLFKVELMSESQKKAFHVTGKMMLMNIDESIFNKELMIRGLSSEERRSTDVEKHLNTIKNTLKEVSHQARCSIHYYECTNILIKNAIEDAKLRNRQNDDTRPKSQFGDVVTEVGQEFEEDDDEEQEEFNKVSSFQPEKESDQNNAGQSRQLNYWYKIQKRVLYTYAFLIAPANGIIIQYLDTHGTNYCMNSDEVNSKGPQVSYEIVPINFFLTTSILKF